MTIGKQHEYLEIRLEYKALEQVTELWFVLRYKFTKGNEIKHVLGPSSITTSKNLLKEMHNLVFTLYTNQR